MQVASITYVWTHVNNGFFRNYILRTKFGTHFEDVVGFNRAACLLGRILVDPRSCFMHRKSNFDLTQPPLIDNLKSNMGIDTKVFILNYTHSYQEPNWILKNTI